MSKVKFITVSSDEAGQRLDNFLTPRLKGVPKSLIYRIIRKGEVRVNKGRAKPDKKLQESDIVRIPPVRVSPPKAPTTASDALLGLLEKSSLYDDGDLCIINKPSGLAVHGGSGINMGLIEALRQLESPVKFMELVHRLDKDTSGCVMIARKRSMLRFLQAGLRERGVIEKRYMALVEGRWPKHQTSIDVPLKRCEYPNGERIVRVREEGKAAKTDYSIIERFSQYTLLEAKPITGRTHQIRVHSLYQGHPLVGDEKYGNDQTNKRMRSLGCKRLFLHASALSLVLPSGQKITVTAPLPDELRLSLDALRQLES